MNGINTLSRCLICNGHVNPCLDLGRQPLANNLLESPEEDFYCYKLGINYCETCGHGQLTEYVHPDKLFKKYLYVSGTSGTLKRYFQALADAIFENHGKASVLDIASNDGSFLRSLRNAGMEPTGIDPAENLVELSKKDGHNTICDYFPSTQIKQKFGVITAMNVLAHTPFPIEFLRGVKDALSENGTAYIQVSQANMLSSGQFDTIYHEHVSFFVLTSLKIAAEKVGLFLNNYQLANIHGDSLIVHLTHRSDEKSKKLKLQEFDSAENVELLSLNIDSHTIQNIYKEFSEKAVSSMEETRMLVQEMRAAGYQIVFAGAAAKALTFYRAASFDVDIIVDEAPLKIGKYVPGFDKPIMSFSSLKSAQKIFVIIGAWNFSVEIERKIREIRNGLETRYFTYFPERKIT